MAVAAAAASPPPSRPPPFTCSLGEMMTFRHSLDFCIQYPKVQNVLYFLFCITLRPNVVGANSEKTGVRISQLPWLMLEQLLLDFQEVLLGSFPLKWDWYICI